MSRMVMKSKRDLDQFHPEQVALTREIDAIGCAAIDRMEQICVTNMVAAVGLLLSCPIRVLQRYCYELAHKADVTEDELTIIMSDGVWNFVDFIQKHRENTLKTAKFEKIKENYRKLFGEEIPEMEED